jgi:hypothetical protein
MHVNLIGINFLPFKSLQAFEGREGKEVPYML